MGQFSWYTQDTHHRIVNDEEFVVFLVDDKGNKWCEKHYEGYGVFGGKDFYELLAEMNGKESNRQAGIDLTFGRVNGKSQFPRGDNPNIKWPSITESGEYIEGMPEADENQGFEILDEEDDLLNEEEWL